MVLSYFRRVYTSFVTNVIDVPPRLLSFLLLLLLSSMPIILPRTPQTTYFLGVLIIANVIAIFAASWDLLVGRAGQISLGHAVFFGIGAYTTALLIKFTGLSLLVTIPIAVLVGTLIALPIGLPCLRVKGPYLALVTMALPLISTSIVVYFYEWTGGEHGLMVPRFFPFIMDELQPVAEYYLSLLMLLISAIVLYKIANSKTGIVFLSILDDELGAKACGINVTNYKLLAFAISALFGSLAGCLYAHFLRVAGIGTFSLIVSVYAIIITILGGIGTIYGAILASYIIYLLDYYVLTIVVDVPADWHPLIFILVVIVIIIKWPRGIARFVVEDVLGEFSKEREIEERGKRLWRKYKKKKPEAKESAGEG